MNREEAIVIVKAAPRLGNKYGETVCTAGVTHDHQWVRLYPVTFRRLDKSKQFDRWDVIQYSCQPNPADRRIESRKLDLESLSIGGTLPAKDRFALVEPMIRNSLDAELEAGRSLAFIRPTIRKLTIEKKPQAEFEAEKAEFDRYASQGDLFLGSTKAYTPCPYRFIYEYEIKDGKRHSTCQDWETEATFFHWQKQYGEAEALKRMHMRWSEELPAKGLLFAMGTHSLYPSTWLLNGLIQVAKTGQLGLEL